VHGVVPVLFDPCAWRLLPSQFRRAGFARKHRASAPTPLPSLSNRAPDLRGSNGTTALPPIPMRPASYQGRGSASSPALISGVSPAKLFRRIFFGIFPEFIDDRIAQVHPQDISQSEQIAGHIRHFFPDGDAPFLVLAEPARFLAIHPLEVLHQ